MTSFGDLLIFCVQDRTGTVAQISPESVPTHPVAVGDTGIYHGVQAWSGNAVALAFTVGQLVENSPNGDFGITTALPNGAGPGNVLLSGWPQSGEIEWLTGANALPSPVDDMVVSTMTPANAYITPDFLSQYNLARGKYTFPASPSDALQQAIVQGTDYLDQKYRFKGIKLLQFLGNPDILDPMMPFIDPWLTPFGFSEISYFTPSTTQQETEWPRQGVVDFNGDSIYGIPKAVQYACAELALRVLNGTVLQPDYDPNIVGDGGIVASYSESIGPIHESVSYDTKLGIGFFPDFPAVNRMLSKAGLLIAAGGRTLIR